MIYIVLGMHKSGTTLISQILHHSGISMVDDVDETTSYDKGNQWERESTKAMNHQLLGSNGLFSLLAKPPAVRTADPVIRHQMSELISRYNSSGQDWGFKDPRSSLVYDEWSTVLPEHRIIAVYRRPEEVWNHYWNSSTRLRRRLTVFRHFVACWCEYNLQVIQSIQKAKAPWIVLSYSRLMHSDNEFRRLEAFVGRLCVTSADPR
ncbi:sulfotransferase [Synechococcus sp. GFB01]|uniref:sulfotransferase n=1 Tax=Synechococcus sp. GFB01 TaxID=1662190 RepID=UPI0009082304|nr:sulfotransferase [Synechococcus sp. GFB01]